MKRRHKQKFVRKCTNCANSVTYVVNGFNGKNGFDCERCGSIPPEDVEFSFEEK